MDPTRAASANTSDVPWQDLPICEFPRLPTAADLIKRFGLFDSSEDPSLRCKAEVLFLPALCVAIMTPKIFDQ
eukprot:scaffold408554_cov43-Prasinocladus_malaysianus.AAC.1